MEAKNKPARKAAPLVVRRSAPRHSADLVRLFPAAIISLLLNAGFLALLFFISSPTQADTLLDTPIDTTALPADPDDSTKTDPLVTPEIDPTAQHPGQDTHYDNDRQGKLSIPGQSDPLESAGFSDGPNNTPPVNLPVPLGIVPGGQGGGTDNPLGIRADLGPGTPGGSLKGAPRPGSFDGRGGETRDKALINGGGTKESEAAVVKGLIWLKKNQSPDGRWVLDGNFSDRGTANDIAGTAFGLLPLLGAGKTHKPAKDNEFDKVVGKGLLFLMRRQDKKTGDFGGGMYSHGLATIAMCEAYGLTQDPALRRPAQMAVNYIVRAQHAAGGWRYSPGQAGDTSVVGWQVMALKSAQMARLDVPDITMRKAQLFLNSVNDATEGYGYTGPGPTPTLTAVGLLCRQYLQAWGPKNLKLIKGIDNHIKTNPPGTSRNVYYFYYATQVMHHFGGSDWKKWNEKMRDFLVKTQEPAGALAGSWNSAGDAHAGPGGRLMITSLSLLTLEVYYRHLPLYDRNIVEPKSK